MMVSRRVNDRDLTAVIQKTVNFLRCSHEGHDSKGAL